MYSIYLNPGDRSFRNAIESPIYVDKTMFIEKMNKLINTTNRFICVSRPRSFGKTMIGNMLVAYYELNNDSHYIFDNYNISKSYTYEKNINSYNVIRLNIIQFIENCNTIQDVINNIKSKLIRDILTDNDFNTNISYSLTDILECIYRYTEKQFIFIIDEWDYILRSTRFKNDIEGLKYYFDFLMVLFKDREYAALVYLTGILPIKKYGEHSALNMFNEYTIIRSYGLSEYLGFTEKEVIDLCNEYNIDFNKMKLWYDGYSIDNIDIYNPNSVVLAILNNQFDDYWSRTEIYEDLKQYIQYDEFNLRVLVTDLINDKPIKVNTYSFNNDMVSFNCSDDILTLLIHLGYLTSFNGNLNNEFKYAKIPNYEIRKQFELTLNSVHYTSVLNAVKQSNDLIKETLNCNEQLVADLIEKVHNENTSIIQYNNENSLSCVITLAYYSIRDTHDVFRELPASKGFADIVFIPKFYDNVNTKIPIIVELKYNKSAKTAIKQIKTNGYIMCLNNYHGEVLLVGINYSKKTKKHTCAIERIIL